MISAWTLPRKLVIFPSFNRKAYSTSASFNSPLVLLTRNPNTKVSTLTLNSPSTLNALTVPMGHDFQSTISLLRQDINIHARKTNCLIITGSGNSFSSGGDLKWLRNLRQNPTHINSDNMMDFYKSFLCMRELPIPIIAAVNGPAIGAGACLALAADVMIMSSQATIGFPFSKLGIHAGMGGSHFLPLRIGRNSRCNEILLKGEVLESEKAKNLGICSSVVENALSEAEKVAGEISSRHPLAVRGMVKSLRMKEDEGLENTLKREADQQAFCYGRDDWGEGINALIEKRKGVFGEYHEK